jgi:hypothetical protein
METKNRISIRGRMRRMAVNEVLEFPRSGNKPQSFRSIAQSVRENYGMAYSISVKNQEKIVVTRIS